MPIKKKKKVTSAPIWADDLFDSGSVMWYNTTTQPEDELIPGVAVTAISAKYGGYEDVEGEVGTIHSINHMDEEGNKFIYVNFPNFYKWMASPDDLEIYDGSSSIQFKPSPPLPPNLPELSGKLAAITILSHHYPASGCGGLKGDTSFYGHPLFIFMLGSR